MGADWCAKAKLQHNPKRRESSPTENAAAGFPYKPTWETRKECIELKVKV